MRKCCSSGHVCRSKIDLYLTSVFANYHGFIMITQVNQNVSHALETCLDYLEKVSLLTSALVFVFDVIKSTCSNLLDFLLASCDEERHKFWRIRTIVHWWSDGCYNLMETHVDQITFAPRHALRLTCVLALEKHETKCSWDTPFGALPNNRIVGMYFRRNR